MARKVTKQRKSRSSPTAWNTAKAKGDALERAVGAIERTILRSDPRFEEGTFAFEEKQLVKKDGVTHEIDLIVTASLSAGYAAVFIFECRNWKKTTSKNDIVIFSEKIKVTSAQRGFFVAKRYSRDARAQAKLDPRITLLSVSELDPAAVMVPAGFHLILVGPPAAKVQITVMGPPGSEQTIDPLASDFVLDGAKTDLGKVALQLVEESRDLRMNSLPSDTLVDGGHSIGFAGLREFPPGSASIGGRRVANVAITGTCTVTVQKGNVVSVFDVHTRGRYITVRVRSSQLTLEAGFVEMPSIVTERSGSSS